MEQRYYNFGLPFNGAEMADFKKNFGYRIFITFGGGMGGGNRSIYTYDEIDTTKTFVEVKDIFGVKTKINLAHVVTIDPYQFFIIDVKNKDNDNIKDCPVGKTQRMFYAFPLRYDVTFTAKYIYNRGIDDMALISIIYLK